MTQYVIYGGGSPLRVESYHPEIAEAEACRDYGFDVVNLVTREMEDGLLPGDCIGECSAGTGLQHDPE
jgi:hypothetical protein